MGGHSSGDTTNADGDKHSSRVFAPTWKSLFNFTIWRHSPALILALTFTIISGVVVPILAVLFGKIFGVFTDFGGGRITANTLIHDMNTYAIGVALLGAATWLSNALYCMAWMTFGAIQATEVRNRLFQNLLHKHIEWYENNTTGIGALLPRIQTQIRDLQMATSQPIGFVAQNLISTLASLALALYYSWKLTLVTISTVPLAFLVLTVLSAAIQPQITHQDTELTRAGRHAHTAISAIETVKSFNAQDHEVKQYAGAVTRAAACYLKQAQSNAMQTGFVRVFTLSMFVQGFWYGHHLTATQDVSFSDVTTAFWACLLAVKAFEEILPQMLVLEKGRSAASALKAILDGVTREPSQIGRTGGVKVPKFCDGDIEVRAVSFAYPSRPDHLALKSSTLLFPAGETTFLVGRSGSGKSTVADLLMRFHEPTTGQIFIDGHDITKLDLNWLRNNITLVQQKTILFNETIRRNISFGKHEHLILSEPQLKKCIEVALLENLLSQLPQGVDTSVGATGAALSGGQRQRIAIARARLRDTPILILDESTSELDYTSRLLVMNAIREWRKGKTTIIITHDMTQIRTHDFVYVLKDGSVVQEGFSAHLMSDVSGTFVVLSNVTEAEGDEPQRSNAMQLHHQETDQGGFARPGLIRNQSLYQRNVLDQQLLAHEALSGPTTSVRETFAMERAYVQGTPHQVDTQSTTYSDEGGQHWSQVSRRSFISSMYHQPTDPEVLLGRPLSMLDHQRTRIPQQAITTHRFSLLGNPLPTKSISPSTSTIQQQQKATIPDQKKRLSAFSLILTVWPNLPPRHRTLLVTGFLAAFINAAGAPIFSYIFSQLMTTFFHPADSTHKALVYSLLILGVAIVDGLGSYIMHYLLESCSQKWVDNLRISALQRILDQPKEWFDLGDGDSNDIASLTTCLDRNALELRNLLGRFLGLILIAVAMVTLSTVWSLAVCWKLTLVCLAAMPGLYGITKVFDRVTARWERRMEHEANACGRILVETFSDIRTVRALTLEGYFHRKFCEATARGLMVGVKRAVNCGIWFGASESAIQFVTALTFWYGARIVAAGDFSIKSVLTVFSMILFSATNVNALLLFVPQIGSSLETGTRLLRLARLPLRKSHEYDGQLRPPDDLELSVHFNDLTFAYPTRADVSVLKDLTVTIPAGRCTVIAGQSGSGKSTLASLILRFYSCGPEHNMMSRSAADHDFPALTISNYSISRLSTAWIRDMVSIVPQTPVIFPTTVSQNITYGLLLNSRYTTTEAIESAAKAAGIHDFILTLPQGYNTVIGDSINGGGGLGLSGGQAQRIVIARALVRQPRLLILDEATSALDQDSASQIRDTISTLVSSRSKNREMTMIVITHARGMMSLGEKVIVLKQGRCVEEGRFDELKCRRKGELANLLRGA